MMMLATDEACGNAHPTYLSTLLFLIPRRAVSGREHFNQHVLSCPRKGTQEKVITTSTWRGLVPKSAHHGSEEAAAAGTVLRAK